MDLQAVGDFFSRDTVPFFGAELHPAMGLALRIVSAAAFVTANAAWEEILYRGLFLETSSVLYSSLSFGLAHLPNMLAPGVGIGQTLLQTLFATAFGFYTADRVIQRSYRLERMVSLHYWNNVLSMVLGYLLDPEEYGRLTVGFELSF